MSGLEKVLKVGIAGHGLVGKKRQFFLDQHPHLKTVAVSDIKYDGHGVLDDGVKFFNSPSQMIEEVELDILFVCLTNDVAADVTVAGLNAGLHVFCEKPPGRTVADIKKVRAAEEASNNLKLKYGFNHRYHDSIREALSLIKSGELGRVLNMRGVYGKSLIVTPASDWRAKRDVAGGGILLDQGIHMVDLMRLFGGEFNEVHSFVNSNYYNYDVEDNAHSLMRSDDGVVAMLHSTATEWRHRFHLELCLEKGALVLSGILSGTKSYGQETLKVIFKGPKDGGNP
jgi:predicted dehydrogenase